MNRIAWSMHIGMLAQLLSFQEGYRQAGVSRYIEYLLRYLPETLQLDERLSVFAGAHARDAERVGALPDSLEWHWTRLPTGKIPIRILWEQVAAPFAASRSKVDIIHGPVNVIPLASRLPKVVTIHDLAFLEYPDQYPALQRRYLERMTRMSTQRADRVIAVSNYTAQDVSVRLGVPESRVIAVPNGVTEEFRPWQATEELMQFRRANQLPDEFLLFLGTLQPRKNLTGLIQAYAQLAPAERIPPYAVGGEGWMYQAIFDEVRRFGLEDDVRFPGYAASDTLPLWYSAATAFVYPSFYEGFGLPVLESMACGTPVVTSNRTSLPEVVGSAGVLIEPDDPESIADGLRQLLHNDDARRRLAGAGLQQARQFTWQRTARETAAVYRDVLNEA
jgi:glycosyltransferase involved in cell wall biosynthesis